jgi:hypothetical protein
MSFIVFPSSTLTMLFEVQVPVLTPAQKRNFSAPDNKTKTPSGILIENLPCQFLKS